MFLDDCSAFFLQDHEWEVVEKPGQSSSPQVSRKDETSSSTQGKPRPEPPTSLPSSPAKKKESSSATPEGTRWWSGAFWGFYFVFSKMNFPKLKKITIIMKTTQKKYATTVKIRNR